MIFEAPITVSPNDSRQYRHITLKNKLECLLVSDPETEKSAACCDVRVGALADPDVAPGLAHFLEHMLFMGTETYPEENAYQAFLSSHGGNSNAYTAQENTVYYFDVQSGHLEGALDIFASFFVCPLFSDSSTDREMNAVDSENSKNLQSDAWRSYQLMKSMAKGEHPFSKFSTGNLETLLTGPSTCNLKTRDLLLTFYKTYYSANLMKVCIYGKESLDCLQEYAERMFSNVPNADLSVLSYDSTPYGADEIRKLVQVVPIKDTKYLELMFPLPSIEAYYRSKPDKYLGHLLGHESEGSILAALKQKGWANALSAGVSNSMHDFAFMEIHVELTQEGSEHTDEIIDCVFSYIGMLRTAGQQEWVGREIKDICDMNFRFLDKSKPISYVQKLATGMQLRDPRHVISGAYIIIEEEDIAVSSSTVSSTVTSQLLDLLHPGNCMVYHVDRSKFTGCTNKKEKWYGTDYDDVQFTVQQLERWDQCYGNSTVSSTVGSTSAEQWSAFLRLPSPNPFVPTDFQIRGVPAVDTDTDSGNAEGGKEEMLPIQRTVSGTIYDEAVYANEEEEEEEVIAIPDVTVDVSEVAVAVEAAALEENEEAEEEEEGENESGDEGAKAGSNAVVKPMPMLSGQSMQTWFKMDKHWKLPKLNVTIFLETNQSSGTPLSVGLTDMLANLLKELLCEYSYYADCAGLSFDVTLSKSGIELDFFGYNHKLPVLVNTAMEQLKKLGLGGSKSNDEVFSRVKERVLRSYYNSLFWPPYYNCIQGSALCLEDPRWTNADKHRALTGADAADFNSFCKAFLQSLKAEVVVHGNASKQEAEALGDNILRTLDFAPLSTTQEPIRRVVDILPGVHYIFRQSTVHFNPDEDNSAIENIYLVGNLAGADVNTHIDANADVVDGRIRNEALLELLNQMITEKAFDQLRTNEQLGYIVFTGIKKISQVIGLQIIVQSNHKAPDFLDTRIEAFLESFLVSLQSMLEEDMQPFKQATIAKLLEKPKNLGEESSRYLSEIRQKTYLFNRRQLVANYLGQQGEGRIVTLAHIIAFFEKFVLASNPSRRKFSSYFYGKGRKYPSSSSSVTSIAGSKEVVVIKDPSAFKRTMPLMPELVFDSYHSL